MTPSAVEPGLPPDPLAVRLDRFEGPLDLLLHLIRRQDLDIFDIPIARITHQFLDVVRGMERLELERAGEFVEMAATLIRIKAQMLFPRQVDDEEEDPRAELVRRLLEYEHFREAASLLEGAERERGRFHAKGYLEVRRAPPLSDAPLETEWGEVWEAVHALAARLAEPEPGYTVHGRRVRMEEKIDYILSALSEGSRVEFAELVAPWGTKMHAVISLLACLELTKRSSLRLRQQAPFHPLWVYRQREREEPDAA
ncbi:MAG TPA: segregation/condensation protein A [Longimicrobiaceae bacterium]|nr:segregation/condensation protein A [Longimicrobiaceae bacterium]